MDDNINWFLTILFNPIFLAFLVGLYFFGKFVGRMVSRPNIWKLLLLCYLGVFFFEPLRNLGWFLGGVFLLGFFSGTIRNLPGILSWAGGLEDIVFALRHRAAYEQLKAQERGFEEELNRARENAARGNTGQSRTQQDWKAQAEQARAKGKNAGENQQGHGAGGRAQGSDQSKAQSAGSRISGAQKPPPYEQIKRRHLETLGLNPDASHTLHDIKKAYRKRAMATHPDKGGDASELRQVVNAWEWLRGKMG
jgi:hypothetical protein